MEVVLRVLVLLGRRVSFFRGLYMSCSSHEWPAFSLPEEMQGFSVAGLELGLGVGLEDMFVGVVSRVWRQCDGGGCLEMQVVSRKYVMFAWR